MGFVFACCGLPQGFHKRKRPKLPDVNFLPKFNSMEKPRKRKCSISSAMTAAGKIDLAERVQSRACCMEAWSRLRRVRAAFSASL
jgi:hypothetical protein